MPIGFKTQAQQRGLQNSENKEVKDVDNFTASQVLGKSMAHIDLMNQINDMSKVIVNDNFATNSEEQKTHFLKMLISNVALNTELNVKNKMLETSTLTK